MKKSIQIFLIAISTIILSCSSAEEGPDPTPVANAMAQGTWRVSEYIVTGNVSVAGYYTGYDFTFSPDGTLSATDGVNMAIGDWDLRNFDNERLKFVIDFYNPETFTYLTNSWHIRSQTANQIILDINEYNYVVFDKNE